MADRGKVIKGLECHSEPKQGLDEFFCESCPYDDLTCWLDVPADALSLLKEHEPVKHGRWVRLDIPVGEPDFKCTVCNIRVHVPTCMGEPMYEFCPVCGAKMDEGEEHDKRNGDS